MSTRSYEENKSHFKLGGRHVATVTSIIDGDTLDVMLRDRRVVRVRLIGVDAPEIKGGTPAERKRGENARKALGQLKDQKVGIRFSGTEHLGRKLAVVYADGGVDVGKWMIDNGHASVYQGAFKEVVSADGL